MFLRPTGSVAAWNFYVDDVDVYVESQATNLDRNLPDLFSMDDATLRTYHQLASLYFSCWAPKKTQSFPEYS
jgi:hypothetical protein